MWCVRALDLMSRVGRTVELLMQRELLQIHTSPQQQGQKSQFQNPLSPSRPTPSPAISSFAASHRSCNKQTLVAVANELAAKLLPPFHKRTLKADFEPCCRFLPRHNSRSLPCQNHYQCHRSCDERTLRAAADKLGGKAALTSAATSSSMSEPLSMSS